MRHRFHPQPDGLPGLPATPALAPTAGSDHSPPTTHPGDPGRPELWAGPEPSVVRVGDRRTDQLGDTGFAHRLDDLDRLAALGVRRLRMPVLWERTEGADGRLDFAWSDQRLERLRHLGIEPIIGLVHHGSGPLHTHLLDPAFADRLAAYAARVAERYPWVRDWTPVNEPLTTARFSALYGLWYPHARDQTSLVRALLVQVHGVRAAMAVIRRVVPGARLVQTEDLGRVSGTWPVRGQVRHENHRRWLSLDLLCGRVDRAHPLHGWLLRHGAGEDELDRLRADPLPPDVIGINHYITSDRFLDHRLDAYPPEARGGNGVLRYADVEAVRVRAPRVGGFEARLREAARRYRLPLAITEVQLGCTREEQMRWLHEAWQAAVTLRAEGHDVRGVTAWATFGAFDWDSLLTRVRGHYEPGLFDVRGPSPRPTATARLAADLAAGREPAHPVLGLPGWWHRRERHVYPAQGRLHAVEPAGVPLLVVGRTGTLGQAFARLCRVRGLPYRLVGRETVDLADAASIDRALDDIRPWAVVNAAGYVRVDDAEHDPRQWDTNGLGPVRLAAACARLGLPLLSFSSDLVFDGRHRRPYRESDAPNPLNAYGRAKQHAEQALAAMPGMLMVRTSAFFGPWDAHNFVTQGLERLRRDEPWPAIADQTVSPTYVPDLVHASLDLLIDGEQGLWHVANTGAVSWYEFACRAAEAAGLPRSGVHRIDAGTAGQRACRPAYSALASERGAPMRSLDAALQRFADRVDVTAGDDAPSVDFGLLAGGCIDRPAVRA